MTALDDRLVALHASGHRRAHGHRGLADIAREKTAADSGRVLVLDGHRALTRGEMMDAAHRLGGALAARGIRPGAAIAFQLPNWWEACVVNLAAALFGYRLVPLLPIYRHAELSVMLAACGVEAIFVPSTFRGVDYPNLISKLAEAPAHVFTVRGETNDGSAFSRLLRHAPAEPAPASVSDIKMILFTSGSTGRPKGVVHTHATIDALIRRAAKFWQTTPTDTFYIPSPIAHIGGSIYAFEFPWMTDCTAILADSWDADAAVLAMDRHNATFMAGATPFLSGLLAAAKRANSHMPSLRRYVCGGASVPPELIRRALDWFPNAVVHRAYGSTEVPLVCPGARDRDDAERRAGTDGEISVDIGILGENGHPVAEGASGEIVVRGPQMLVGYLDAADDAEAFTDDGFFRMGDLGRRIEGRYLEITGRKKDIIIRKGENISPLEIENALSRHPSVRQSAVVGIADAERGEIVVAFVLPIEGASFAFDEMTTHLAMLGLARQKFPERLHVVASLPVNAVGKVEKTVLRRLSVGADGARA